jgi:hypothetical protein
LFPFFLPVYTTTCDSTKKKKEREQDCTTLYSELRICRELKSTQQAKSDGSPGSSSSNNNSNATATRARTDTQAKAKENLGRQKGIPHVPENYYFYYQKSAHSDLLYCSSYLPPP